MNSSVFSCITLAINGQHCHFDDHDKRMMEQVVRLELEKTLLPKIEQEMKDRYMNPNIELQFDEKDFNIDIQVINREN